MPSWESYGKTRDALYLEGIYVGYRYYDKAGAAVRWPFGFGLSYTSFAYANLRVEADAVTAEVINTGNRPGAEVAQLYLAPPPGGAHRPVKELKGFARVYLRPGERRTVRFPLTRRSFAIWQDGWKVPGGVYTVLVGGNSRDLPLRGELPVDGEVVPAPDWQPGSWYEHCSGSPGRREWEAMLGRAHVPREARKGDFTLDNSLMEMREDSRLMGVICGVISRFILWKCGGRKAADSPEARMLLASSVEAPLRCVQISSGISGGLFQGLVDMANGHFFRGVGRMLRAERDRPSKEKTGAAVCFRLRPLPWGERNTGPVAKRSPFQPVIHPHRADDPGGHAGHHRVGGHVPGDHRPGGHNGPVPDGHAGGDGGVRADPCVFPDDDGGAVQLTAPGRVLLVVQGGQHHAVAQQGPVPDGDAGLVLEVAAGVDEYVGPDGDVLPVIGVEGGKQAEAGANRPAGEFGEETDHLFRFVVRAVEPGGELQGPLRGLAHVLMDGQAQRPGPLFKNFISHLGNPLSMPYYSPPEARWQVPDGPAGAWPGQSFQPAMAMRASSG